MKIEWLAPDSIFEYSNNVNQHPPEQVDAIADSIREFGITKPVLIDVNNVLIAGHGTRLGAIAAGLRLIPCIRHANLSARQVAAYRLADNQLAKRSSYDFGMLADEIDKLVQQDFDVSLLGFDEQQLAALLQDDAGILPGGSVNPPPVDVKAHTRQMKSLAETRVFSFEQIWLLGSLKLSCQDCETRKSRKAAAQQLKVLVERWEAFTGESAVLESNQ